MPFAATWMNLEIVIMSERQNHMVSLMRKQTHTHRKGKKIKQKQRQTQRQGTDWSLPEEKVVRAG